MAVQDRGGPTLRDVFTIKRGLATGANDFFILTEADTRTWQIPRPFLKPILPGPRHLVGEIIEALADGEPDVSPRLYLLDCSEPEEWIKIRWPRFYEYLRLGRQRRIHASYLASRRAPWYSQEQRPAAPFLCTYMGRTQSGKRPFRFLWNRSQATAHNVYLMMYPKGPLREALEKRGELARSVFEELQRIAPSDLLSEGRVYGGGLHKLEPAELGNLDGSIFLERLGLAIHRQAALFG
jgi:hypothetical protein